MTEMTSTFLERIVASTRADLEARKVELPLDALRERVATAPASRDFATALRPERAGSARLIAEVKRASPSKGLLAERFDPVAQARAYQAGGAAVISVLTEPHYFRGSLDDLRVVRAAVDVPVLRKDFVADPYQVYEARAAGADAVLLICALLDDASLRDLLALTHALGMEALVEAHNAEETRRAVASGARVIGVNARDLRSFAVDTEVIQRLRPLVPSDRVFVAESGIADRLGAMRARAWGADAILVGEALMRAADPTAKARELTTAPGGSTNELFSHSFDGCFVKLCGLVTVDQADVARDLGANAVGLVFYPLSPRAISPGEARRIATHINGRGGLAFGLFVNETIETVLDVVTSESLSGIQLSGDETPEYVAELACRTPWPILKAVRLRSEADLALLDAYGLAGATILLDAHVSNSFGGTGRRGDWDLARRAAQRWPIVLAGGLTPENVAEALRATGARGVDVSSGIETDGVKDPAKMRAFVARAREGWTSPPALR